MTPSRRQLLLGALAAPIVAKFAIAPAGAQTDPKLTQLIGLQRMRLGESVITAISDGYVPIDVAFLSNVTPEEANKILAEEFMKPSPVITGVNAFVVSSGDRNVLIDAGGAGYQPEMGKLLPGLDAAGIARTDIHSVLLTHLHIDHIGALVSGGKANFPNADVHVHEKDAAYFAAPENRAAAPEPFKVFFDRAKEVLDVYADRVRTFAGETEVVPGILSRELFGHTPGHSGFVVRSGDDELFIWGDVVHVGPVQFAKPSVGIAFDVDGPAAIATRKAAFEKAAAERTRIAGMHIAFPGIGHLAKAAEGDGYDFKPAPWVYALD